MFTDNSRGRPFAKDPAVVKLGERYLMYYSVPPFGDGRQNDGWAIGIATSSNLKNWVRIGEIAAEFDYERNGFCAPGAIVINDRVELFYQSYGNGPKDAICHATSNDGLSFTRNNNNPIWRPTGAWNNGRAIDADVAIRGDQIYLLAATRDASGEIQMLTGAYGHLTAGIEDVHWVQLLDEPLLEPSLPWEQKCIEAPALLVRDGVFHLFYAGAYNCAPQQIGHAVSENALSWTRTNDKPLLSNGLPGEWNSSESGHPFVFEDAGLTYLFFQGSSDDGKTWQISSVEITWDGHSPSLAHAH
ncbi:MAG TPA: family 43 glycosylhydrolase [Capsulimonadaceae bacterium]|jgi:predicted GH43/DUF377 family glycosyl hydrolase